MGPLFVMTKKINTIRLFVFTAHLTSSVQIAAVGARGSHGCTGIRRLDTTQASLSAVQAPSIPLGPCLCYRYFIWVISSSRILLQEIYPNYDVPHDRLRIPPTTTHVPGETSSTSVISPTTHRGLELTWGRVSSPPPTCINTHDQ